jgi:hypothetical protein
MYMFYSDCIVAFLNTALLQERVCTAAGKFQELETLTVSVFINF